MTDKSINNKQLNDINFADESDKPIIIQGNWKILVVDDDNEIHNITKMVLEDVEYHKKKMNIISAFSGSEAKNILESNDDIALIILDVVMEEDDAGLKLVDFIRNNIKNEEIRIILRTGYPGQAPEKEIIVDYDINDYKEKTELSSQKLITSVISALRSYEDLITISDLNKNLEQKVLDRTIELNETNKKLSNTLDLIERDLNAGRKVQFQLLPGNKTKINQLEFDRYLKPSLYLSGDFLDYFAIDENKTGFYFADVSGHGAASAFITVFLKRYIDGFIEHYRNEGDLTILNPALLLNKLNLELIKDKLDKYLTIFFAVYDAEKQKLKYLNAGQFPYPIIKIDDRVTEIKSKASPAGMFKFTKFQNEELTFNSSFEMLIVSDGLMEIMDGDSLLVKQKKISDLFKEKDATIDNLIDYFKLNKLTEIPDDITLLKVMVSDEK